jgi:hypothetical protein
MYDNTFKTRTPSRSSFHFRFVIDLRQCTVNDMSDKYSGGYEVLTLDIPRETRERTDPLEVHVLLSSFCLLHWIALVLSRDADLTYRPDRPIQYYFEVPSREIYCISRNSLIRLERCNYVPLRV